MQRNGEKWVLGAMLAITTVVSLAMWHMGRSSLLEVFSFITGALCVWLTVKENVWNFPISLVNVVAFAFVFFQSRLFSDAGLQVVYFVLTLHGWYLWLHGGEGRTRLQISRLPPGEALIVAAVGMGITAGLTMLMRHLHGAAPFWDALTTAICLCAQYLLNRKYVESWYCWIAADVIYIPLYFYKDLWLTSVLYAVFLVMANMGLARWLAVYRESRLPAAQAVAA
jgi:nicotinamide mononucleotide transporter